MTLVWKRVVWKMVREEISNNENDDLRSYILTLSRENVNLPEAYRSSFIMSEHFLIGIIKLNWFVNPCLIVLFFVLGIIFEIELMGILKLRNVLEDLGFGVIIGFMNRASIK